MAARCSPRTARGNQQTPVNKPTAKWGKSGYASAIVRSIDSPRSHRRHSPVLGSGPSANSPRSRTCPVTDRSHPGIIHAISSQGSGYFTLCPQGVLAAFCVAPTRSRAAIVLCLVRMISFDQPVTAREAVPADCTARCAPSRSSSLRCGPPLTAPRLATGLAPKTSRAGNSLRGTEPGDIQNRVQQKSEIFWQA